MSVFDSPLSTIDPPMAGELALYRTGQSRYPYFTSGDLSSKKAIVLIGGLTAGLGMVPYASKLTETLQGAGWKLYVSVVRCEAEAGLPLGRRVEQPLAACGSMPRGDG